MKKTNLKKAVQAVVLAISVLVMSSCKKNDNDINVPGEGFTNGFYILNEGPFQTGTGTIDFVNDDGTVTRDIFAVANNGMALGNIVQSVCIIGPRTFVVVNNANKIERVNTKTFVTEGITGELLSPRYMIAADDSNAFVSCIGDNSVKIVSLVSFTVTGSLPVNGPEKMMKAGNHIWVLNQGGYSVDSTITVIDIATKTIVDTIAVYPQPSGIREDIDGNIWVMCTGRNAWHPGGNSEGHLICIDPEDFSVIRDIAFPSSESHPEELAINSVGDVLYYRYPDGIYRFGIAALQPEAVPFIPRATGFYTLAYDAEHGLILGSDPADYISDGWVFRFNAVTGVAVDSIKAGILPGEIYFVP
jgi:hypothetical protein